MADGIFRRSSSRALSTSTSGGSTTVNPVLSPRALSGSNILGSNQLVGTRLTSTQLGGSISIPSVPTVAPIKVPPVPGPPKPVKFIPSLRPKAIPPTAIPPAVVATPADLAATLDTAFAPRFDELARQEAETAAAVNSDLASRGLAESGVAAGQQERVRQQFAAQRTALLGERASVEFEARNAINLQNAANVQQARLTEAQINAEIEAQNAANILQNRLTNVSGYLTVLNINAEQATAYSNAVLALIGQSQQTAATMSAAQLDFASEVLREVLRAQDIAQQVQQPQQVLQQEIDAKVTQQATALEAQRTSSLLGKRFLTSTSPPTATPATPPTSATPPTEPVPAPSTFQVNPPGAPSGSIRVGSNLYSPTTVFGPGERPIVASGATPTPATDPALLEEIRRRSLIFGSARF